MADENEGVCNRLNRKLLFRNEHKGFSVDLSGISGYLCTIVLRLIQF